MGWQARYRKTLSEWKDLTDGVRDPQGRCSTRDHFFDGVKGTKRLYNDHTGWSDWCDACFEEYRKSSAFSEEE